MSEKSCPHCQAQSVLPWYKNKVIRMVFVIALILGLSLFFGFLVPLRVALIKFFHVIWFAVLLGLVLGGVIEYFVPKEYVSLVLAKKSKRTILYAVFTGFLMSACSHGILALAIQLHKKGASPPAVVAFLLASPWANMALTIILIGFFGWTRGLYIIFSAILIAIITGLIFQKFEKKGIIETNKNTVEVNQEFSIISDMKKRISNVKYDFSWVRDSVKGVYKGTIALADMVMWWILLGLLLASLISAYVPTTLFNTYLGPSVLGLFVTLAAATVIEVCSEGSAPIALEIFNKTGAIGNSFVFLMAGVVTDYTEIGLLWQNVGKKTAILLPLVTVPQVVFMGWLANLIF